MHLQNTVAVKDKIETLCSRIATLEKLFERPPSDDEEMERRGELLMYACGLRSDWMLNSPPVNSRVSKKDCGSWAGNLRLCDTSIMFKTAGMSADFPKT